MDLRQYDSAIGRWVVQDPVIHHEFSPYSAFDNNPVFWSDPSGADAIQIGANFHFSGDDAIKFFEEYLEKLDQNESTEETVSNMYEMEATLDGNDGGGDGNGNGGGDSKRKYKSYSEWFQKVLQHKFLNNFTFEDAIYHYNFGEGESVTVNLNTLNFDGITVERFLKSKEFHEGYRKIAINFLGNDYKGYRKEQGLIYGNITLVYIGNNTIMALPDQYNFEMHKGDLMTRRNVLTFLGSLYNGQGTAKIKTK